MHTITSPLAPGLLSRLPAVLRSCLTEPDWWADEMQGLQVMNALNDLVLPAGYPGYRKIISAPSIRWPWRGHTLAHQSSLVHAGAVFFGPVLIGPGCEIGPNATVFGPAVIEAGTYLGPSAEIRRSLLLNGTEISHMSYVGHSVIGRNVCLGAFFCAAVRNLRRGTVHVLRDGALIDTAERTLGCVIADGTETGVHTTVMPGRRVVRTPVLPAHSIVMRNC